MFIIEEITFEILSSLTDIGNSAFSGCLSLTQIIIPSSVTSFGEYTFSGCSSLTQITFEILSSVTEIGNFSFYKCSSLTQISIPSSVTSIVDDVKLPPWANNSAINFIYLHRKALESKYVSSNLLKWINLIWGCNQDGKNAINKNNVFNPDLYENSLIKKNPKKHFGQIPKKLFLKKHQKKEFVFDSPIKSLFDKNKPKTIKFHFDDNSYIKSVNISYLESKQKFTFTIVSSNKINSYILDFSIFNLANTNVSPSNTQDIKCSSKGKLPSLNAFLCIPQNNEEEEEEKDSKKSLFYPMFIDSTKICYIDDDMQTIFIKSNNGSILNTIKMNIEIVSLMTDPNGWLAVSTIDSSVTLFDINNIPKEICTFYNNNEDTNNIPKDSIVYRCDSNIPINASYGKIPFFRESIKCIAINQTFHIFVCGTKDKFLFLCCLDLNKMVIDKMIELDGQPSKIIVTDNFGFIVVQMTTIRENKIAN